MDTSGRIMMARRAAGMSQAELARIIRVNRSAVSHWECGRSKAPSVSRLGQISKATSVSFEWLATGGGSMWRENSKPSPAEAVASEAGCPLETRLISAFRGAADSLRFAVVEVLEAAK
jgi:transcriptional regulator with XRE-family HTH domain